MVAPGVDLLLVIPDIGLGVLIFLDTEAVMDGLDIRINSNERGERNKKKGKAYIFDDLDDFLVDKFFLS